MAQEGDLEIRGCNTHTTDRSRPREHANAFGRHGLNMPIEVAGMAYSERKMIGVDHEVPESEGATVA